MAENLIYGVPAKNEQEFFVARALWKLGHSFRYQVPMLQMPGVRGGQVIDFVVDTPPLPTPILYHGDFWHYGTMAAEDYYNLVTLTHALRGFMTTPVVIWGKDVSTYDAIYAYLRVHIGPP